MNPFVKGLQQPRGEPELNTATSETKNGTKDEPIYCSISDLTNKLSEWSEDEGDNKLIKKTKTNIQGELYKSSKAATNLKYINSTEDKTINPRYEDGIFEYRKLVEEKEETAKAISEYKPKPRPEFVPKHNRYNYRPSIKVVPSADGSEMHIYEEIKSFPLDIGRSPLTKQKMKKSNEKASDFKTFKMNFDEIKNDLLELRGSFQELVLCEEMILNKVNQKC